METKTFRDPQDAYYLMNRATRIQTKYEVKFAGKRVTKVEVLFKEDEPFSASVHYKTKTHEGVEFVDLKDRLN